jgi:SAM-dependent methyltransferase
MRKSIKDVVRIAAETLPFAAPVYEFGSLQVEGQEGFADLRPFFAGREFVGCDMRPGLGVDRVLDLHAIDLPDASVGSAISLDTLEHVEYPHRAVAELHRVLRPGGLLLISSVMNFHIHDHPHDYWRFTPDAFRSLLKPFSQAIVESAGREVFPHTVVGLGCKDGTIPPATAAAFEAALKDWKRRWWNPKGSSWETAVMLLTPPLLIDLYRKLKRA